jgi:hypothetical protein
MGQGLHQGRKLMIRLTLILLRPIGWINKVTACSLPLRRIYPFLCELSEHSTAYGHAFFPQHLISQTRKPIVPAGKPTQIFQHAF